MLNLKFIVIQKDKPKLKIKSKLIDTQMATYNNMSRSFIDCLEKSGLNYR